MHRTLQGQGVGNQGNGMAVAEIARTDETSERTLQDGLRFNTHTQRWAVHA